MALRQRADIFNPLMVLPHRHHPVSIWDRARAPVAGPHRSRHHLGGGPLAAMLSPWSGCFRDDFSDGALKSADDAMPIPGVAGPGQSDRSLVADRSAAVADLPLLAILLSWS